MLAFLRGERGMDVVADLLLDDSHVCYAHAINLCEVFYDFVRTSDVHTAQAAMRDLAGVGVRARRDMSQRFWQRVGELKGTIRRVQAITFVPDCSVLLCLA